MNIVQLCLKYFLTVRFNNFTIIVNFETKIDAWSPYFMYRDDMRTSMWCVHVILNMISLDIRRTTGQYSSDNSEEYIKIFVDHFLKQIEVLHHWFSVNEAFLKCSFLLKYRNSLTSLHLWFKISPEMNHFSCHLPIRTQMETSTSGENGCRNSCDYTLKISYITKVKRTSDLIFARERN